MNGGKYGEPVWEVELVNRADGRAEGTLVIGMDTGSMYGLQVPGVEAGARAVAAQR